MDTLKDWLVVGFLCCSTVGLSVLPVVWECWEKRKEDKE